MAEENGNAADDLSNDKKAAFAYGLAQYQVVADERDQLRLEVNKLKGDVAVYKVMLDAKDSQILELESRQATHQTERDQAVADRAKYETLFVSIKAQLGAFNIPAAPFIRDINDEVKDPNDPFAYLDDLDKSRFARVPNQERSQEALAELTSLLAPGKQER